VGERPAAIGATRPTSNVHRHTESRRGPERRGFRGFCDQSTRTYSNPDGDSVRTSSPARRRCSR
jgi:hypothetical protein